MKRAGDNKRYGFETGGARGSRETLAGSLGPADDDLARRVIIRGNQYFARGVFGAQLFDRRLISPEHRHHAAWGGNSGFLHIFPSRRDEFKAVFK